MSKHTQGGWEYLPATKESLPIVYIPHPIMGATTICTVSMRAEQEANAKLIASAPELLEICEDIKESLKTLYQDAPVIAGEYFGAALSERINDIINKAKGES